MELLIGKINEAKRLAREYNLSEQYYREIESKARRYKEDLKVLVARLGPALENLNMRIIEQFTRGRSDEGELARELGVPTSYLEGFALIKIMEKGAFVVPPSVLANILNTSESHIRYLRHLLMKKKGAEGQFPVSDAEAQEIVILGERTMQDEVIRKVRELLPEIKEKFKVKKIGFYGREVYGELGFLTLFPADITYYDTFKLEDFLEDHLQEKVIIYVATESDPEPLESKVEKVIWI